MDEVPSVNRREAVAGVSLLSALLLAVVGTLAYRAIDRTGETPGPGPVVALQSLPAPTQVVEPPAQPQPVFEEAQVLPASSEEAAPVTESVDGSQDDLPDADELFAPADRPATKLPRTAPSPRFVAPGE